MRTITAIAILLLMLTAATAQDKPAVQNQPAPPQKPEPKVDQAELEKQFERNMTGATLVGRFSVERRGNRDGGNPGPGNRGGDNRGGGEPKAERYEILKVTKMRGDYWLFNARVQYGNKDVTAPIVLQVKWAGDTPVITLTDVPIPGLGTYTARVLIYRDHYAGYWSGGEHGGNLWGRVERGTQPPAEGAPAPEQPK